MKKTILKELGMTDSEVEVYLDLIKNGASLASQIASRIKISRTYIYDAIEQLIRKGIVNYVLKNNRKVFKAKEPEKLIEYIENKEKLLEKQKQDIKQLIPYLKKYQAPKLKKPEVEVLEGKEGLKTILNDIVREEKDVLSWGATSKIYKHLPDFFIKRYLKEKEKKNIKTTQLYTKDSGVLKGKLYKNIQIPEEYSAPVTVGTYGKKTAIFVWSETPIVISINSEEVAKSFKKHIKLLMNSV